MDDAGKLDFAALPRMLDSLAASGCHGVLLAGSTGEGPSLSVEERTQLIATAVRWRNARPPSTAPFALLAGSGAAALPDAIGATRACLAAGADVAVVQPPFYFPGVAGAGIESWYAQLIEAAVGPGQGLMLYDIPRLTGVPIPIDVAQALQRQFPRRVIGIKDSRGDAEHAQALCAALPAGMVLTGHDGLVAQVLAEGGAGSITALTAVRPDLVLAVWEAHAAGADMDRAATRLKAARQELDQVPTVAGVKALWAARGQPIGPPRAPLVAMSADAGSRLAASLDLAAG